jgi:hypothetical protein
VIERQAIASQLKAKLQSANRKAMKIKSMRLGGVKASFSCRIFHKDHCGDKE